MTGANITGTIELADFKAGIVADYHGGIAATSRGSNLANGAAVIDGTFGCCADASGALVPLPKATTVITDTTIYQNDTTGFHPSAHRAAYLNDAYVTQGASNTANDPLVSLTGKVHVYTMYGQFLAPAGGSVGSYQWCVLGRVYGRVGTPFVKDWLWESSNAESSFPHDIYTGMIAGHHTRKTASTASSQIAVGVVGVFRSFSTHALGTAIAANELPFTTYDTDVSTLYPTTATAFAASIVAFPNPTTPTAASAWAFIGSSAGSDVTPARPYLVTGHQGRLVFYDPQFRQVAGLGSMIRDLLFYTPVVDFKLLGPEYSDGFMLDTSPDNPAGIGVIASTNTDELLVIKHRGGAILLRGDLDNPTVVRLPGIESTYNVSAAPVNTPIGLVYGTRNGIYVWGGGQTAEKLSKQIDGFFWDHAAGDVTYEANRGRFGYFHPWVAVPNNYLFDTRTGSWWRLADPAARSSIPYNVYLTSPTDGKMFAFPYKITAAQQVVYDVFDPTLLASSYTWRSQPLVETLDELYSFGEITLVASSGNNTLASTVTVTLTGYDKSGTALTPVATVFNLPASSGNGQPVIIRSDIAPNFNAMYVQVAISTTVASGAAPKIHRINLGHGTRTRSPKS